MARNQSSKRSLKISRTKKSKVVYPKAEEEVMFCPKCNAIFYKEAAKGVEMFQPQTKSKGKSVDRKPKFNFDKRGIPHRVEASKRPPNKDQQKKFTPPSKAPFNKWMFSGGKQSGYSAQKSYQSIKWVQKGPNAAIQNRASGSNRYAYNNNYKGKNPMTKTQWRRFQRQNKYEISNNKENFNKFQGQKAAVEKRQRDQQKSKFSSFDKSEDYPSS